jgi:mannose-6-phosphate isomerase
MQTIFRFKPIYKARPWGGRKISQVAPHHQLPEKFLIGESWEISDRDGDESVISEGEFSGKTIRWLLDMHGAQVMGRPWKKGQKFPLLIKLLDARERLSLQVHPPVHMAEELKGEPKTEMWFMLKSEPHAAILAGLKKGVRQQDFESAFKSLNLEPLLHRISMKEGDAMFIPSGRLHAIDAGCLILEIQQNSDTTYRVYDWGRVGLDGKPREMHLQESLKSINFDDFEPSPILSDEPSPKTLVECNYFKTDRYVTDQEIRLKGNAAILHVLKGNLDISATDEGPVNIKNGETILIGSNDHLLKPKGTSQFIVASCR